MKKVLVIIINFSLFLYTETALSSCSLSKSISSRSSSPSSATNDLAYQNYLKFIPFIPKITYTQWQENGKKFLKACALGDIKTVEELLNSGEVDINVKSELKLNDEYANTPLMLALTYGHLNIAYLLLKCGADVNVKTSWGHTALIKISESLNTVNREKEYIDLAKLLIRKGANINEKDIDGQTALYYAIYFNDYLVTKFFLENNANIDTQDVNIAIEKGTGEIITLLKEYLDKQNKEIINRIRDLKEF